MRFGSKIDANPRIYINWVKTKNFKCNLLRCYFKSFLLYAVTNLFSPFTPLFFIQCYVVFFSPLASSIFLSPLQHFSILFLSHRTTIPPLFLIHFRYIKIAGLKTFFIYQNLYWLPSITGMSCEKTSHITQ